MGAAGDDHLEAVEVEPAAVDGQADTVTIDGDAAPARAGRERAAERTGQPWGDPEATRSAVPVDAAQGEQHAPAGQRTRVVVAALRLVPRAAPDAVVSVAGRADDGQGL